MDQAAASARWRWSLGLGGDPSGLRRMLDSGRELASRHAETELLPALGGPRKAATVDRARLQESWLDWLLHSPVPELERMTLFWHGHFTSDLRRVRDVRMVLGQHQLLRSHALGSYEAMLRAIPNDPAMLVYLDGNRNRRAKPNENFARELLELFTLGEGNYSETDVSEAARAFTGWRTVPTTGEALFMPDAHDEGDKNFLGRSGNFGDREIIDILLETPRVSEYIVSRLWTSFVSPQADAAPIRALAESFRKERYEIAPTLRRMVESEAYSSPANRGSVVKGPIEMIVGMIRSLGIEIGDKKILVRACRQMGQNPFNPPNVKGWPGGLAWVDTSRLLMRDTWVRRLLRGNDRMGTGQNGPASAVPEDVLRQLEPLSWEQLAARFLTVPPLRPSAPAGAGIEERLVAVLTDPAFQVF